LPTSEKFKSKVLALLLEEDIEVIPTLEKFSKSDNDKEVLLKVE